MCTRRDSRRVLGRKTWARVVGFLFVYGTWSFVNDCHFGGTGIHGEMQHVDGTTRNRKITIIQFYQHSSRKVQCQLKFKPVQTPTCNNFFICQFNSWLPVLPFQCIGKKPVRLGPERRSWPGQPLQIGKLNRSERQLRSLRKFLNPPKQEWLTDM